MAEKLGLDVKIILKTSRKTYFQTAEALDGLNGIFSSADKYLRPELADGLDHSGRSFFKTLWERNLGPRKEKVNFRPGGLFNYLYRLPRGYAGNRKFRAMDRGESIAAFTASSVKTMNMAVDLYSDSKVARYQEEGGTIYSKGDKLAVPLPPQMQGSKFMYTKYGALKAQYKNPSGLGLSVVKLTGSKGTQYYLCKRYKTSKRITPMYVLKDSVSLKKPMLRYKHLFGEMQPQFHKILDDSFNKGIQKWREGE
jgi:hypothetical protein